MGNVIRREDFVSSPTYSFEDIEARARKIIADAEFEARQIVDRANAHARKAVRDGESRVHTTTDQHRRQAYERGLEEGRAKGFEQARRDGREAATREAREALAGAIEALSRGFQQFELEKRALLARAESGLIELALAVARRVCRLHVEQVPVAARDNARALLEMVSHHDDVEVRLNPEDCELLGDVAGQLVHLSEGLQHVTIRPDAAVDRGGCVLKTRAGTIDATVAQQLDRLAAALCPPRAPDPDAAPGEETP